MCATCRTRESTKIVNISGCEYRKCDCCGDPIPKYPGMEGVGFESLTVHHYHGAEIPVSPSKRKSVQVPVMSELCHPCYVKDFQSHFPDETLPDIANLKGVGP